MQRALAEIATRPRGDGELREEFQRKDGARIELRAAVVFDEGDRATALVGTLRDVTAQRDYDHDREQRIDELTRTVLFSEMFIGILAHDLQQPLAGIVLAAQLAAKSAKDEGVRSLLARIGTMGSRTARMVDQLLDFTAARLGSGIPLRPAPGDLLELVQAIVAEVSGAHPECAVVVESVGATTGTWDGDRLAQALSSIISNAIEHGVVAAGVRVKLDGSQPLDVVVEVHNEGALAAELTPTLFHPFRAAHQKRDRSRGLGLGLYVTRQIAVAHGGDVSVASSEADGTTVRMRLPRVTAQKRPPPVAPPDELLALQRFSMEPQVTAAIAQLFGASTLEQRAPRAYEQLSKRYDALLDLLVRRRVFKDTDDDSAKISEEIRAIAERLGALNAGAREVAELHAEAIRKRTRGVAVAKSQALVSEGRMMAFELMGRLLSFYRRRTGFTGVGATTE